MLQQNTGLSLSDFQGRWQHSLVDLGLLTVFDDVAFLDRGTALRLAVGKENGSITAGGWIAVPRLSGADHIIWVRDAVEVKVPDFLHRSLSTRGALSNLRLASLREHGLCAWSRVRTSDAKFLLDRWAGGPQVSFEGPEAVAAFAVPPPAAAPAGVRPRRILVYGDSLTAGWPSGDPYSRTLVDALCQDGVFAEVVGCGMGSVRAAVMAGALKSKDIRDQSGLRGEGLERLIKTRGPFDLVVIMAGTVDVVRGESGMDALRLHAACHRLGVRTAAVAVPPTWHDDPASFSATEVQKLQAFYTVAPEKVSSLKAALNAKLRELASSAMPLARARCEVYVDAAEIVPCSPDHSMCWDKKDWLHFTAAGSQQLGRGLAKRLLPVLLASASIGGGASPGTPVGREGRTEPADRDPAKTGEAGPTSTSAALPAHLIPQDRVLKSILRFARPDWTNQEIMTVLDKLVQANIKNRAELLSALRGDGGSGLNEMIKKAGHKAFSAHTLQMFRDQFDTSGMGIREEVVTYFRVVHTLVVVRRTPYRTAQALGTKRHGDVVAANAETLDGWLRLHQEPGWLLRDMRGEEGLGVLLEPHEAEGSEGARSDEGGEG